MEAGLSYCPHCKKRLTANEMYCWHCENSVLGIKNKNEKPHCFIATAVYGENANETNLLRAFRDKKLGGTFAGTVFTDCYYIISPYIAKILKKNNMLRFIVRFFLDKIVLVVKRLL